MVRFGIWSVAAMALAACGGDGDAPHARATTVDIAPDAFAVRGCGDPGRCALIVAGGKTLLVGASSGVGAALGDNIDQIDMVLLPALDAATIEGLDEVRNRGWTSGRREALAVAGPVGTGDLVRGLNAAFETSDAIAQVKINPPGGYGAALLAAADVSGTNRPTVFNTGDLVVELERGARFEATFLVRYGGTVLAVASCESQSALSGATHRLTCSAPVQDESGTVPVLWPGKDDVVFVE